MTYSPSAGNNRGIIGALVSAAITRAAPDYMPLARQANASAFYTLPRGPYFPKRLKK
jgi:hypothetical protein